MERLRGLLSKIYGAGTANSVLSDLTSVLDGYRGRIPVPARRGLSQRDAILITYADQVRQEGLPPLASLADFCKMHLNGLVSGVHILPFYPWSSDDGFSVTDYRAVAPEYGTWDDVRGLGEHFRLMFDAVVNHTSAASRWFHDFLQEQADYLEFFVDVKGSPDLSDVVRPRALPLLTEFDSPAGKRQLWTTFSADQVDLNYHNPRVLLRIVDILLFYASQGAEFIRLDAIAYLWKEPGTACINLPQTHWIVQLMRAVLDEVAPHVRLITETNVESVQNLSYFGDGSNEAQLVYNFPLPPLVLHALQTADASVLAEWAAGLQLPSDRVTFLNFLASHDGIGLNPVRGILPESEIQAVVRRVEAAGGFISNKANADGTESPYEINMNYFEALSAGDPEPLLPVQVGRFVAAHAVLLSCIGVPALYFHSLFGSRGWPEGVARTHKYRTVNREKLQRSLLENELADRDSLRAQIFAKLSRMLRIRAAHPAFSPETPQRILKGPGGAFSVLRGNPDSPDAVLCVQSVSSRVQHLEFGLSGTALAGGASLHELITGRQLAGGPFVALELAPYQTMWLTA